MRFEAPKSDDLPLARELAAEGIVLLRNDDILPISVSKKLAVFGKSSVNAVVSGMGSGGIMGPDPTVQLFDCLESIGIPYCDISREFYQKYESERKKENNFTLLLEKLGIDEKDGPVGGMGSIMDLPQTSGIMYEIFGSYQPPLEEPAVPDAVVAAAREETDTALLLVGHRTGSEECDRLMSDYYLLESEKKLIAQICGSFPKVIAVINENSIIDLSWVNEYQSISALLSMGAPGEQGIAALCDLLTGRSVPSGKLAQTMAADYWDYPSSKYIKTDKSKPDELLTYESFGLDPIENNCAEANKGIVSVYGEDIYTGYRYFDTFGVQPLFPFGFGLSYTDFSQKVTAVRWENQTITLTVKVKNTGNRFAGKEVVQVYLSAPAKELSQPYQRLVGFEKTDIIPHGESRDVSITIPIYDIASYDEKRAAYVLEPGDYLLRVGNSSKEAEVAVRFTVSELIIVQGLTNRLSIRPGNKEKLQFLSTKPVHDAHKIPVAFTIGQADVKPSESSRRQNPTSQKGVKTALLWQDVVNGNASIPEFLSQMTDEELAVLCCGYGPGIAFEGRGKYPATINYPDGTPIGGNSHQQGGLGYVSPSLKKYGVPSARYSDGPAGVSITAWPTETVLARTWNKQLLYRFGQAVGRECLRQGADCWLAPAVNCQRYPLCGRNFEYFSEDPFLSGVLGAAEVIGVSEAPGITACPKHFACNEQETYRRGRLNRSTGEKLFYANDSILSERAAREIYLKPFEMIVKTGKTHSIMTSFNRINGCFAAGSYDLCTAILRDEWGFDGVVVTDWGDMDVVVDGGDAVAAGNDVVMPGGPPAIGQILQGLKDSRVSRDDMLLAAAHLLNFVLKSAHGKPFEY